MPAPAGDTPDVLVRARHGAVAVPGLAAPHDTVHYRIFHPARRSGDDRERLTGMVPPDPARAPWPVVLMLPGINIGPEGYRWLAVELAEAGYATVTMALVGDTLSGVVGITPGLDLDAVRPDTYLTRPSGIAIGPLLDVLAREHSEGPLAGLLDLDRVVLAGHSGGGSVALQNANPDWFPGVVGCATYASHTMASSMLGFEPETVLPVAGDVPTLLLAGELDGVMARSADRYESADPSTHDPVARTFDEAVPGGRGDCWYAVAAGATHTGLLWPPDPTTARGFLDPPPGRDPDRIRADLGTTVRLFLDTVLAEGDPEVLGRHLDRADAFVTWRRK